MISWESILDKWRCLHEYAQFDNPICDFIRLDVYGKNDEVEIKNTLYDSFVPGKLCNDDLFFDWSDKDYYPLLVSDLHKYSGLIHKELPDGHYINATFPQDLDAQVARCLYFASDDVEHYNLMWIDILNSKLDKESHWYEDHSVPHREIAGISTEIGLRLTEINKSNNQKDKLVGINPPRRIHKRYGRFMSPLPLCSLLPEKVEYKIHSIDDYLKHLFLNMQIIKAQCQIYVIKFMEMGE